MKSNVVFVLIIGLVLNIILFPKNDKVNIIDDNLVYPTKFDVKLSGEVVYPGNYSFYEPVTLREVISYAGGLTSETDRDLIDLNEIIKTSKVFIFKKINDSSEEINNTNKVNINKASFIELKEIMSESRALSLLLYREANGPFKTIDELLKVKNIGTATLEKLKPLITL